MEPVTNEIDNYFIASVCLTDRIGCIRAKLLLEYFGSGKAIWQAPKKILEKTNLPKSIINLLDHFRRMHPNCPEQLREYCEKRKIKLVGINDTNYPKILKSLPDAPVLLYYKGELRPNDPRIAIVGTRQPTRVGLKTAQQFGEEIARSGITVVSGAAFGIDMAAHEGALKTGRTVAILGEGLEAVMSSEKRKFLDRIIENGAVITEYSPNTAATKGTFPHRNRIIAGLSVGVVVVEAGESSGAMNTAQHAANYGKLTFAVPGSIYEDKSRGCHELIRDGVILARSASDIIEDCKFNIDSEKLNFKSEYKQMEILNPEPESEQVKPLMLEDNEKLVFDVIPKGSSISTEEISIKLDDLAASEIQSILLNLEMKELIIEGNDGNYTRS